jgi:hypothetical protein
LFGKDYSGEWILVTDNLASFFFLVHLHVSRLKLIIEVGAASLSTYWGGFLAWDWVGFLAWVLSLVKNRSLVMVMEVKLEFLAQDK